MWQFPCTQRIINPICCIFRIPDGEVVTIQSVGTRTVQSAGTRTVQSAGTRTIQSAGTRTIQSAGTRTIQSAGTRTIQSAGTRTVQSASTRTIQSAGTRTIQSAGTRTIQNTSAVQRILWTSVSILGKWFWSICVRFTFAVLLKWIYFSRGFYASNDPRVSPLQREFLGTEAELQPTENDHKQRILEDNITKSTLPSAGWACTHPERIGTTAMHFPKCSALLHRKCTINRSRLCMDRLLW